MSQETPPRAPLRVAVVGAGAAGTLVALNLVRRTGEAAEATGLAITFVDPAERLVSGAAFSTTDPAHLLNVPAAGMSWDPEDRFDFATWCADEGLVGPEDASYWFAPRREWARYLRTRWQEALAAAGDRVVVEHVRRRAVAVVPGAARGAVVTTEDGVRLEVDRVVLATGLPTVGDAWAPRDLSGEPRYVADPWWPGALDALRSDGGDVLVVGTGLTMVDVALTALAADPDRRVVALSRHGRLPHPHAPSYLGEVVPDVRAWGSTLPEVRAAAHAHVGAVAQLNGDWRPAIDGIRYRVAELWSRFGVEDRRAFLAGAAGEWGVRRHRVPPTSDALLAEHRAAGRLEVRAGTVTAVEPCSSTGASGEGLEVTTADGDRLRVACVVNCTGPRHDVRTLGNPVLDQLLGLDGGQPVARTDELGLGLETRDGRLLAADGEGELPVWTLGALRRGELWESTAVPEIRAQAVAVGDALLGD
ncbi:FAD/NAD(P)-binding protein [Nocardioides solisilvae]|uniref:FAD/NAD(P)-binding protein n=1 Tax=Nocardioides solisilvae TaxID=1542435 RepID=UPI00194E8FEA|nr:FAD/NAD(P)-binding protein [Nocardioides solisilvae]